MKQTDNKSKKTNNIIKIVAIIILIMACIYTAYNQNGETTNYTSQIQTDITGFNLSEIPQYTGVKSYTVNNGNPFFTDEEIANAKDSGSFESYGKLDSLGRCTAAIDNLSTETMPAKDEERESIRDIKPTGWKQAFYNCVYNETVMTRTHLVGWMLSAENANERNLITGTRYMNADAMTTLEIATVRYIENGNGRHVLYRVTPVFEGTNLMASGVLMEGLSLDDGGNAVRFCEYLYNVQPGIMFDYSTGENWYSGIFFDTNSESVITDGIDLDKYIIDGTKIHSTSCMDTDSDIYFEGDISMIEEWDSMGYTVCDCVK